MSKNVYGTPIAKSSAQTLSPGTNHYSASGQKLGHSRGNYTNGGRTFYGPNGAKVASTNGNGQVK